MKQSHGLSRDGPAIYQITVQGCLDGTWSAWFDGLIIHCQDDGKTLIAGPIADQPALHGVLKRIRDLGLPLLMVRQLDEDEFT
ncbi:MAG: hypothetical protein R3A44_33950 [Caldilineaceae bacterium]